MLLLLLLQNWYLRLAIYTDLFNLMKHIVKDSLKAFEKALLFSRKKVKLPTHLDRRIYNSTSANNLSESNLIQGIKMFHN